MATEKLILFQKSYDFLLWLFNLINCVPKSHKIILGQKIENIGLQILTNIISANKAKDAERLNLQEEISTNLDTLRILIRLCKDLHFISVKQYTYAAKNINEIAKIHNSWMKV